MPIPGLNKTLRVRWPKTIDGINIAVDENGTPIFQETELPFTAKPFIEKENMKLPIHLRKKMDVMNYTDTPPPESKVKGVGVDLLKGNKDLEDEIVALKARLAEYEKTEKAEVNENLENEDSDLLGVGNGEIIETAGAELGEDESNGLPIAPKKKAGRPAANKNLQNA